MHPTVSLAKKAIAEYITTQTVIPIPGELTEEMKQQAGVFVSIKKEGMLRGCIGTFSPTQPNIAKEIIENAISSSTRDPRFPPITSDELESLNISVDILSQPEKIKDISELDPKTYGIIVKSGLKRGLLLPNLEGVDTTEEQIAITKRKAGIENHEDIEIMKFEVKRYT